MPEYLDLGAAPSILIVRRDNIGDLLLSTPAFSLLRQRYPRARIAALVTSYTEAVLQGNPDLDEVFVYSKAKHAQGGTRLGAWLGTLRSVAHVRRQRFNLAIVCTSAPNPGWIRFARWCGPRHILAAVEPGAPPPRGVDLPVSAARTSDGHATQRIVALLAPLGVVGPPPATRIVADPELARQARRALGEGLAIGLHISARKPRQRWPAERFAAAARALHRITGARFALFWAPGQEDNPLHPGDDGKAQAVIAAAEGVPLVPMPSSRLEELVAGIAAIDLMLCSDGGAMHVAAGLGKPIVALFGNSDPAIWRPWAVAQRVLRPESQDVGDVEVESAVDACLALMRETGLAAT